MTETRACRGGATEPQGDMERCKECRVQVNRAFVTDPLHGFETAPCEHSQHKDRLDEL